MRKTQAPFEEGGLPLVQQDGWQQRPAWLVHETKIPYPHWLSHSDLVNHWIKLTPFSFLPWDTAALEFIVHLESPSCLGNSCGRKNRCALFSTLGFFFVRCAPLYCLYIYAFFFCTATTWKHPGAYPRIVHSSRDPWKRGHTSRDRKKSIQ